MNNAVMLPRSDIDVTDVWKRMADEKRPLFMYGTGNGADKIINEMEKRNIPLAGIFASDGFVRKRVFRGHEVTSYGDICKDHDDFSVILAFGSSRPEVLSNVKKIASERILYCPDVPAFGNTLFDAEYYLCNFEKIKTVYDLLEDEESKRVYSDIIHYKLSGDTKYLFSSASQDPDGGILRFDSYTSMLDLGAYTGDTVRSAIEKMPNIKNIYAVEPDSRAFRKLSAYAESSANHIGTKIIPVNAAAWSEKTTLYFTSNAGRGSTLEPGERDRRHGEKDVAVPALSPDIILKEHSASVDFVKYDVEGAEEMALLGSKRLIREFSPDLLVSLYHRSEDIFKLPLMVKDLCPEHKLYIRRAEGVPAWDINLYAVK